MEGKQQQSDDNPVIHMFDARQFTGNIVFNGAFFQPPSLDRRLSSNSSNASFFCVYRTNPSVPEWFESNIRITRVEKQPGNDVLLSPQLPTDRLLVSHGEDPRVLPLTERHLLITYTDVTDMTNTRAVIRGQIFLADYEKHNYTLTKELTFDLNASRQNKQKNWNFFVDPYTQHVMLIYRLMPFELYDLGHVNSILNAVPDFYEKDAFSLECLLRTRLIHRQLWKHPHSNVLLLRGGSNPIYIRDGVFYLFVHSATYRMFCLVMTKPNFFQPWRISKVGSRPIVYHDTNIQRRQVHFPGGAVYDPLKQSFTVCMGLEDQYLGYVHLDKSWVDDHLVDVQST